MQDARNGDWQKPQSEAAECGGAADDRAEAEAPRGQRGRLSVRRIILLEYGRFEFLLFSTVTRRPYFYSKSHTSLNLMQYFSFLSWIYVHSAIFFMLHLVIICKHSPYLFLCSAPTELFSFYCVFPFFIVSSSKRSCQQIIWRACVLLTIFIIVLFYIFGMISGNYIQRTYTFLFHQSLTRSAVYIALYRYYFLFEIFEIVAPHS